MMSEPGSGFDNFDANDVRALEKPLLTNQGQMLQNYFLLQTEGTTY